MPGPLKLGVPHQARLRRKGSLQRVQPVVRGGPAGSHQPPAAVGDLRVERLAGEVRADYRHQHAARRGGRLAGLAAETRCQRQQCFVRKSRPDQRHAERPLQPAGTATAARSSRFTKFV